MINLILIFLFEILEIQPVPIPIVDSKICYDTETDKMFPCYEITPVPSPTPQEPHE